MREFEQKKIRRKILYSPITLILLFLAIILLFNSVYKVYKKEVLSRENLQKTEIESRELQDKINRLQASVNFLQTDEGVEAELRSKFRAVKDGESVTVIVDDSN